MKEKDLVYSREELCGFTFDTVALARLGDLYNVHCQIGAIEAFARDLRKNGGFLFFREHYPSKHNKIYNGTNVFWCPDRMEEAFPMFSAERTHFCEGLLEAEEGSSMELSDNLLLNSTLKKREKATRALEAQGKTQGPRITYHYKGQPGIGFRKSYLRFIQGYLDGPDVPD